MADGLVELSFLVEGDAEVVVGVGVIRFEADGFLELADRLVDLAFPAEGDAEVLVGLGIIRFQAEASWYWRMASSVWPFLPRALPRL